MEGQLLVHNVKYVTGRWVQYCGDWQPFLLFLYQYHHHYTLIGIGRWTKPPSEVFMLSENNQLYKPENQCSTGCGVCVLTDYQWTIFDIHCFISVTKPQSLNSVKVSTDSSKNWHFVQLRLRKLWLRLVVPFFSSLTFTFYPTYFSQTGVYSYSCYLTSW